ncbi:MAG TPA: acetate--CoA ligase [Steroidobacteraceae bacterium]
MMGSQGLKPVAARSTATVVLRKTGKDAPRLPPNLADYAESERSFTWERAWRDLGVTPGGRLNIAEIAVDRHAKGPRAHSTALRILDQDMNATELTYVELAAQTNRFANVLASLQVEPQAVVATFVGRLPELYVTALGTLKSGRTYCPLFSAFGPEPAKARLGLGDVRVLITTDLIYRRKIAPIRDDLPGLRHVLVIRSTPHAELPQRTLDFHALIDAQSDRAEMAPTTSEDRALLHFTSGTTGMPKGVEHVHAAVIAQQVSANLALDLHDGDIYWCTADPGWVTGTAYGIIGPLCCGVSLIVDSEEFDVGRWYSILERERVSVWYTAPTAIRMLMKAGRDPLAGHDFSSLRFLGSVGEPLNPEAVVWGRDSFGLPFHDNWWQTETGAIMIANYASMDIRPGSMGRPLPGVGAGIVTRRQDGSVVALDEPDQVGELALRPGWPSMFRGYLNDPARYAACFSGGWYLTGDLARRDADGYYWFVGRADDVIKSAGHLISPFEVESALMSHPAVAQAAVIGVPDPIAFQAVKAYIELKPGVVADDDLSRSLLAHARRLLGAAVAPREIAITAALPRTRSGKIMRRLLRARELGLPEGDLSTLEPQS